MTPHNAIPAAVRTRIQERGLTLNEAAREIGIGVSTLRHHLDGGYARSDSIRRYNNWLVGRVDDNGSRSHPSSSGQIPPVSVSDPFELTGIERKSRWRVVDLFSGCGGLSLGFELLDEGSRFELVMAADIDQTALECLEQNAVRKGVTRRLDIGDILSEAEALAIYLDHVARSESPRGLRRGLENLSPFGIGELRRQLRVNHRAFQEHLQEIAEQAESSDAPGGRALGQSAVLAFLEILKLPRPTRRNPAVPPDLVWDSRQGSESDESSVAELRLPRRITRRTQQDVENLLELSIRSLRARTTSTGRGQLRSSSQRIQEFLRWLDGDTGSRVLDAWLRWRVRRDSLRRTLFDDPETLAQLQKLYRPSLRVSVLLGGPPCQGFSRIGRGKIRSLRQQSFHSQYDPVTGDSRNRLLHQYVLFVSALRPQAFLFENVSQFQSEVSTDEGGFQADQVLEEAIRNVSQTHTTYAVSSRIVDASSHLIPQTRRRYFMTGLRDATNHSSADRALELDNRVPVPLAVALEGLPPALAFDLRNRGSNMSATVAPETGATRGTAPSILFRRWIQSRRDRPGHGVSREPVDGHVTRPTRADDRRLFRVMGPGSRWMDLHARKSDTLSELRSMLATLGERIDISDRELRERLDTLLDLIDETLPLRLLLESIEPIEGEPQHHLLGGRYMSKRSGNHGDWLCRLAPDRPSRTIVSHLAKDTYQYIHPWDPRGISVREAARIQSFPDWFSLKMLSLVEAYRVIGNAVPPLLSYQLARNVATHLDSSYARPRKAKTK